MTLFDYAAIAALIFLIVAAVGLALITTVNQLSAGIVSLYQSITGDLSSIGAAGQ